MMVDSDSDLDLGNSAEEDDEEDHEDVEVLPPSDVLAKKNLITKSECNIGNLYTIQEEDEREKVSKDSDRKIYSDISRLELYFKQLAESSNK